VVSICPNITSKFRTIVTFKSFVIQRNNSNKSCRYVHDLLLHTASNFICVCATCSWGVCVKPSMNFNIQPPSKFAFLVSHKNGLLRSSLEDLSAYNILWSRVKWYKLLIHLRWFNVRHFGIVEGTQLESMESRPPSMACPSYQISWKSTNLFGDGWTGLIRLAAFTESSPKWLCYMLWAGIPHLKTVLPSHTVIRCCNDKWN
jgi:hypothetical protein